MNVGEFRNVLSAHPNVELHFMLPSGEFVPSHFHVTEVGRVQKDFIDCGGTMRSVVTCLLQVWVAEDTQHRLTSSKLANILNMATKLLGSDEIPVEIEYEADAVSQFPVAEAELTPAGLLFQMGSKHTDCLAKDRCGIPSLATAECGTGNCC